MKPTARNRFIAWVILVSLAWLCVWRMHRLAPMLFSLAYLIALPKSAFQQRLDRSVLAFAAIGLLTMLLGFVIWKTVVPPLPVSSTERFLSQPIVIGLLWAINLAVGYTIWTRRKGEMTPFPAKPN